MFDRRPFDSEMERCCADPLRALGRRSSLQPGAPLGFMEQLFNMKCFPDRENRSEWFLPSAPCLFMLIGLRDFSRLHLEGIMGRGYNI